MRGNVSRCSEGCKVPLQIDTSLLHYAPASKKTAIGSEEHHPKKKGGGEKKKKSCSKRSRGEEFTPAVPATFCELLPEVRCPPRWRCRGPARSAASPGWGPRGLFVWTSTGLQRNFLVPPSGTDPSRKPSSMPAWALPAALWQGERGGCKNSDQLSARKHTHTQTEISGRKGRMFATGRTGCPLQPSPLSLPAG